MKMFSQLRALRFRKSTLPAPVGMPVGDRRRERGFALLLVLGSLFALEIMAGHLVAISEVSAKEALIAAERARLSYGAESAIDRAFWLLLADRKKNPTNRTMGTANQRPDPTQEVWMADGGAHEIVTADGIKVRVAIQDAECGIDVSGPGAVNTLRSQLSGPDKEKNEDLDRFLDIFQDYLDTGDDRRLHGKEREDYAAEGWPDLPRNGAFQFRDEAFWLEGLSTVLNNTATGVGSFTATAEPAKPEPLSLESLRIIPPPTIIFPRTQKPNFFSATPTMIQQRGANQPIPFNPAELALIQEAKRRWSLDHTPIDQSLDPPLYQRLNQLFSFQESGVGTFVATAISEDGDIRREMRCTRDCRQIQQWNYGTPTVVYWDEFSP